MCVYGRCRCSDLRFVQEICLDVTGRHGFIEAITEHHKTANREKRRLLVPAPYPKIPSPCVISRATSLRLSFGDIPQLQGDRPSMDGQIWRRQTHSKARHMVGRMSFASGQTFGRLSKSCLKAFYSVLERSSTELDPGTVAALSMYVEIAQHAPARTINLGQRPCLCVH